MKDEHIYAPSFKKALLEKINSLKQQLKRPPKDKVAQTVEPQPIPTPIKVVENPIRNTLPTSLNQTLKSSLKVNTKPSDSLKTKPRPIKTEKTGHKTVKHKMTRESEEKILVFTLLFSVVAIILLGIFLSYKNLLSP